MKKFNSFLNRGLLRENAAFMLLAGLCPLLAASATLAGGIAMGVSALVVLLLSSVVISLIGKIIPEFIKPVVYILVIAAFVTAVEILLRAFFPVIFNSIGLYIPLLAVSGIMLARAEKIYDKNKVSDSVLDALATGLGFLLASIALSFVRELFGGGTLLGFRIFPEQYGARLLSLPAGGLILLGFMIAAFRLIIAKTDKEKEDK